MRKHPAQPVEMVDGVARFKENKIVTYLLDAGPFDMNHLASLRIFSSDDRQQFAQLIGYSVDGYRDLSYSDQEVGESAAEEVRSILAAKSD